MVTKIESLAREFGENGLPEVASLLNATAQDARRLGAPEGFSDVISPELQAEWQLNAQKLAGLFAKLEGKSEAEYVDSLPKPFPQQEGYRERFDIPLIVPVPTKNVPLKQMLEIASIVSYYDANLTRDWEGDSFRTPDKAYFTWVSDGSSNLKESVEGVRTSLTFDSRGGTLFDGIGLIVKNPDILKDHFLDLPGSRVGSGDAPLLARWREQTRLNRRLVDVEAPRCGSVVAGRKIRT